MSGSGLSLVKTAQAAAASWSDKVPVAGTVGASALELCDGEGIALAQALAEFREIVGDEVPGDITGAGRRYLLPLINGEAYPPYDHGMPVYAQLRAARVPKRLRKRFPV